MTLEEMGVIMDILTAAYPNFHKAKSDEDIDKATDLWAAMFAGDDARLVAAAVKAFIAADEKGFPPHIGAIKAKMAALTRGEELTEYEAWNLVRDAVSNGYYGASEEFAKLPVILQRLVGSANQLRTWAAMESSELNTVVASNFMRSYRARSAHEREHELLPEDVKSFMGELAGRMSMPELPPPLSERDVNERRNAIARELELAEAESKLKWAQSRLLGAPDGEEAAELSDLAERVKGALQTAKAKIGG